MARRKNEQGRIRLILIRLYNFEPLRSCAYFVFAFERHKVCRLF